MVLNEEQWIKELREKRIAYGISQGRLAVASGITREYLNKIESGKMKPSKELLETLYKELARFNPEAPLTMLFDYVKIRFPTLDIQHIIKDILKLNINYMLHEDYGHYSYTEHYSLGDIFIYTSADEEKGVLLELKGRGCRQFESYLLAQQRSWYDFLMDALVDGGVMKRIDLAINDHTGILDIPELAEKCRKREYIGKSRSYKFYQSGELIKHREDDREYMGRTLYLGSLKSDVYFCTFALDFIHSDRSIFKIVDLDEAWAFLNVAQGETLSNKLVRAGRAMQAGVYFVTQSSGDVSKESLKNNIGLKFAFRSTDINEIKQTLEFFGIDKDDENNQKRLRDLENGQCLLQDLYGRVGVVQIHHVFEELLHAFDTRPPVQRNEVE